MIRSNLSHTFACISPLRNAKTEPLLYISTNKSSLSSSFFPILMTSPFCHHVHLSQFFHFIKVSALPSLSYYFFINIPQILGIIRLNSICVESLLLIRTFIQTMLRSNVSLFAIVVIYHKEHFVEPQA